MSDDPIRAAAEDFEPDAETGAGAARSLVDRLAQKNAHAKKHLDRPIPVEWQGRVVVRFGRVSKRTLMKAAQREGASDVQLVVEACREIFVRGDDGDLVPCSEADGQDAPVRFDGRLAEMFKLGEKAHSPYKIALLMYGNEVAITAAALAIYNWQTGENLDEVDLEEVEELVGEA